MPSGRRAWLAGGGAIVAAAGVAGLLWPGGDGLDPRARVYTDASACLLTPTSGPSDRDAAPVWAGMQQASLETHGRVSFLEVDGPQTAENAATYLGTLAVGGCDLVLAAGPGPVAAVQARASEYLAARFVAVGKATAQGNVVVVAADDPGSTTSAVRALVNDALTPGVD